MRAVCSQARRLLHQPCLQQEWGCISSISICIQKTDNDADAEITARQGAQLRTSAEQAIASSSKPWDGHTSNRRVNFRMRAHFHASSRAPASHWKVTCRHTDLNSAGLSRADRVSLLCCMYRILFLRDIRAVCKTELKVKSKEFMIQPWCMQHVIDAQEERSLDNSGVAKEGPLALYRLGLDEGIYRHDERQEVRGFFNCPSHQDSRQLILEA